MFSIILPSYLGEYKDSATNKESKLHRAIESVLNQTVKEYELIVVSDGCEKTIEIASQYDINIYKINKQSIMSGVPRQTGIKQATQDWIIYIDSDDCWGKEHLQKISDGMCCNWQWFYFNDWVWNGSDWEERKCNIRVKGNCGTANIVHKRSLPVKWGDGYLHDWRFIQQLHKYQGKRIDESEYFVCHIPKKFDV